jgi:hypothetical protein
MGDVADMMLDGTLCEMCGVFVSDTPPGYPQYCSPECAKDRGADFVPAITATKPTVAAKLPHYSVKVPCSVCNRSVKRSGMRDHMRDAHQLTYHASRKPQLGWLSEQQAEELRGLVRRYGQTCEELSHVGAAPTTADRNVIHEDHLFATTRLNDFISKVTKP